MRFPKSLRSKTQKQLKELFFIKNEFESDINGELAVTDTDRQSNATYNMKLLLELLLPTSFPIENKVCCSIYSYVHFYAEWVGGTRIKSARWFATFASFIGGPEHIQRKLNCLVLYESTGKWKNMSKIS